MDKDAQIAALETALKCERIANKRLRDDRRWDAFCAALGGLNANSNAAAVGDVCKVAVAKGQADDAVAFMCADEPVKVSPDLPAIALHVTGEVYRGNGVTSDGITWEVYAEEEEPGRARATIKVGGRVVAEITVHAQDCELVTETRDVCSAIVWSAIRGVRWTPEPPRVSPAVEGLAAEDRWEVGLRNIAGLLYGSHVAFEIKDVVEAVRSLISAARKLSPAVEAWRATGDRRLFVLEVMGSNERGERLHGQDIQADAWKAAIAVLRDAEVAGE